MKNELVNTISVSTIVKLNDLEKIAEEKYRLYELSVETGRIDPEWSCFTSCEPCYHTLSIYTYTKNILGYYASCANPDINHVVEEAKTSNIRSNFKEMNEVLIVCFPYDEELKYGFNYGRKLIPIVLNSKSDNDILVMKEHHSGGYYSLKLNPIEIDATSIMNSDNKLMHNLFRIK